MRAPPPWMLVVAVLGVGVVLVARGGGLRRRRPRRERDAFHEGAATRLVATGLPSARAARIWVRSDRSGPHVLSLADEQGRARTARFEVPADPALDGTTVVRWPEDVGREPLSPLTRYTFRVTDPDGALVGAGRFRTAPLGPRDAPDHFAIGLASCHQPFTDAGGVRAESLRLLGALEAAFEVYDAQLVLFLGDQMYTDLPAGRCLFDRAYFERVAPPGRDDILDCSRAEVRALLQERHRIFWKIPAMQRLQAMWPSACMLDDHEIVDNYGSDAAHGTLRWAAMRAGALDAFHDYQALRNHDRAELRPTAFPTRFAWGPLAGLVLDLRSERLADERDMRILGPGQWAALERFLAEEAERPVLLIGLSVPLLHVPEWLVEAGAMAAPEGSGIHDRWSHPRATADRDRLVRTLHAHRRAHPDQQVVLVGGDVHVGAISQISWDGAPPVLQLVTSAVSNLERRLLRFGSEMVVSCRPSFETEDGLRVEGRLLAGERAMDNPYQGLNAGILELRREGAQWLVRLLLVSHDDGDPPGVRVVFDSGER